MFISSEYLDHFNGENNAESACKLTMLLAVAIRSYNEFPIKHLIEADQHTSAHCFPTRTSSIFISNTLFQQKVTLVLL